jgi:hypothetical protein
MSRKSSESQYEDIRLNLADGYLPHREVLLSLAGPYGMYLNSHCPLRMLADEEISTILFDAEHQDAYEKSGAPNWTFYHAWILSPQKRYPEGFELTTSPDRYNKRRRSFLTIAGGLDCEQSDTYLELLLDKIGFMLIPSSEYRSSEAFEEAVSELFNRAVEPYIAPALVVTEKLQILKAMPTEVDLNPPI